MPLPEPRADEARDDFVARCAGSDEAQEAAEDNDQAVAMCGEQWDSARGEEGMAPAPEPDEGHDAFVGRCMGEAFTEEECEVAWEVAQDSERAPGDGEQSRRPCPPGTKGTGRSRLRVQTATSAPESIDRKAGVLRGYVVAQEGPFKTPGRGAFDRAEIDNIVALGNAAPRGLKSRLAHATLSDDGVAKFLGRGRDFRVGKAIDARTGKKVSAARADLHFDRTALEEPVGGGKPLAVYVMDRVDSDPDSISSSLVVGGFDLEEQLDARGKPRLDGDGNPLPPLWRVKGLDGSDIVDTGDAVDGLLSADDITRALQSGTLDPALFNFDRVQRLATLALDGLFKGQSRCRVGLKVRAWLDRYLALRFGPAPPRKGKPAPAAPPPRTDARRKRLEELTLTARKYLP